MSSSDLCVELKNWVVSLGFVNQNVSTQQIQDEFSRLTPPEMRDIWRSISNHVVPVQNGRYIRKVLLLNELKKRTKNSGKKLEIPESLKSISDLQLFEKYEKLSRQLKGREFLFDEVKSKTAELKKNFSTLSMKRKSLFEDKENQNNTLALLQLKIRSYEQLINELNDTHECLTYVNSFWSSTDSTDRVHPSEELIRKLFREVDEFGKRRHLLDEKDLILEQEKLLEYVNNSIVNIKPSHLQKNVIGLLGETLSLMLKLTDHISTKLDTESDVNLEREVMEMRKRSVHLYMDCRIVQEKVKKQEEKVQNQLSKVLSNFEKDCANESERNILKTWLDTEYLRHRMTTRHQFLMKMERTAKGENSSLLSGNINFTYETEREKFFKTIYNCQTQLATLERDISNNLTYLTDKSINIFINYQKYCKNKIKKFLEQENTTKKIDFTLELYNALKKEIVLLENLQLRTIANNNALSGSCITSSDNNGIENTRKCNFLIYFQSICDHFFKNVNDLPFNNDTLHNKRMKIQTEEKEFLEFLMKLFADAKNNLKLIETESEICSRNMELWINFSINDLIPKHMVKEDYTFTQWQERYRACINRLLK